MTYEELVNKLKSNFEGMDAGRIKEHLAIQFNVAGEAEGALYMEIKDGRVMIEPYEYYDRDILVFVETDALVAIADGQLTIYEAFKEGRFYAEGNLAKAELLDALSKRAAARKIAEHSMEKERAEAAACEPCKEPETEEAEPKAAAPVPEKKSIGRKIPSRKLRKAAAKKNARKNMAKK